MPRSAARGFFRGALLWLGAVLSVVVHVPGRARAEILILKDGSQLPCRVLAQDKWQVTVRDAGGNRLTLKKKDIARIEPTVSSVEVYEAVAELVPADGGLPGYYLGVWCLENGIKSEARRMFEMATRDPELAGRACFALAGLRLMKNGIWSTPALDRTPDDLVEHVFISLVDVVERQGE